MKISVSTPAYNARRYGRPWIARVDFSEDPQGVFEWGKWIGDNGSAGLLEVEALPYDVVCHGQKDGRGNKSAQDWYFVVPDGTLTPLGGRADALEHFRRMRALQFS